MHVGHPAVTPATPALLSTTARVLGRCRAVAMLHYAARPPVTVADVLRESLCIVVAMPRRSWRGDDDDGLSVADVLWRHCLSLCWPCTS